MCSINNELIHIQHLKELIGTLEMFTNKSKNECDAWNGDLTNLS